MTGLSAPRFAGSSVPLPLPLVFRRAFFWEGEPIAGGEEALGSSAAGGSVAFARASLALARGEPQRCLDVLSRHA